VELFLLGPTSVGLKRRTDNFEGGGGMVIYVRFRHGIDPYFDIPMPRSMKGWRKRWFYLKNDADARLPTFTGNLSYRSFENMKLKPLYVFSGCSNHTYSNNMVNRYNILINYKLRSLQNDPWVKNKDYRVKQRRKSKRRCGFHRHNQRRGRPSFILFHPADTLDFTPNLQINLKQ
jgi:hypothetical protein